MNDYHRPPPGEKRATLADLRKHKKALAFATRETGPVVPTEEDTRKKAGAILDKSGRLPTKPAAKEQPTEEQPTEEQPTEE